MTVPLGHRRFWVSLAPAAVLLALAAACFARLGANPSALIVDGRRSSIDYANRGELRPVGNDLLFLFLPHHWSIRHRLSQFGHWPAWDARGFGGRPLAGNPQAGMYYPPVWLAWWSGVPAALGWLTVAHLLWSGLGLYLLVRSMGTGRWAATVAAGIYQASPYLLAHTFEGHYPHVWAASWYPWAFLCYRDYRAGRARGLLLGPILALTFLVGHPQEWLFLILTLSIWATIDGLRTCRTAGARRSAAGLLVWFGLLGLSIGIAAVDVAPQWAVRPWLRSNHDPGLEVEVPRRYHLGGLNAFQLLSPSALGGPSDYFGNDNYWETVCSIGLVPLVLAALATARFSDRRLVRGWLLLAAVSVAFAFGRSLGLYSMCCAVIPGLGWIRVPARSLFLANLACAVLAGLGIETLRDQFNGLRAWRRLARRLSAVAVVVLVLLFVYQLRRPIGRLDHGTLDGDAHSARTSTTAAPLSSPTSGRTARAASRILHDLGFWSAIGGLTVLLVTGCRPIGVRNRRLAGGLIGLIALGELGWCGFSLLQVTPAEQFVGWNPVNEALKRMAAEGSRSRRAAAPARQPVRIKARDSFYGDLPAVLQGVEKTNVDDAFQLDHAAALYETLYPVASRVRPMTERLLSPSAKDAWRRIRQAVFDRMSVEFLVSDRVETDPPWPVISKGTWDDSPFVIQRNATVLPRAYVVPRATILPDHAGVVLTAFTDLDPRGSVLMTADPLRDLSASPRQPFTAADWTSTDPDRPALVVTTQAPGLLVVADTWMPGWTARVDGRPAPVYRGNYAQRVIPLNGPGRHVIMMEYHPPAFILGWALSIASALAWLLILGRRLIGIKREAISREDSASAFDLPGFESEQHHGKFAPVDQRSLQHSVRHPRTGRRGSHARVARH